MQGISIIGVGNLGGALAAALSGAGWKVEQLIVRNDRIAKRIKRKVLPEIQISQIEKLDRISGNVVLISVDDPEIANVASGIASIVRAGQVIFHTSGSRSSSELRVLKRAGAKTGSLHPLTSISDPITGANQFRGTYFCVEGEADAVRVGRKLVRSLGGQPFSIETKYKPLYHAAAVSAAGHVTTLLDSAVRMMELTGLDKKTAKKVILPLAGSTLLNLGQQDSEDALTGTFARLDIQTFQRHLSSFGCVPDRIVHLYLELGETSLDLVEKRDGASTLLAEFRKAISVAKRKYRC